MERHLGRELEAERPRRPLKRLQCYAHGHEGAWEAICVDLDIAVQGSSLDEVRALLDVAIQSYCEDAIAEDRETAVRLLNRRAPFSVRFRLALDYLAHTLRKNGDDELKAGFDVACPA